MLGVVLGLAIAVQGEPKLEWATFGEFSAKLNEGSGYRLVMDKAISDRPVVWYFSKPGENRFELLRRSCKELCLNFEVDEPLKKVFVAGPNVDAGPTMVNKILQSIADTREFVQKHWGDSDAALKAIMESDGEGASEFERDLARQLRSGMSRALLSAALGMDARALATGIARDSEGMGLIPVTAQLTRSIDAYFSANLESADNNLVVKAKQYFERKKAGASLVIRHYSGDSGDFGLGLDSATDSDFRAYGDATVLRKNVATDVPLVESKDSRILNTAVDLDAVPNPLFATMNWYQTIAIPNKWNTVSWFDPTGGVSVSESMTLGGRGSNGPAVHGQLSDDGWMVLWTNRSKWKEISGDWSGLIRSTGVLSEKSSWMDLLRYLNSLSDSQLDGMKAIEEDYVGRWVMDDVMRDGWLIRAGLRELAAQRSHDVFVYGNTLGSGAGGDLSRFWRVTDDPVLLRPSMVGRRSYAVLNAYEQVRMSSRGGMDYYVVFNLKVPNGVDEVTDQFTYFEKKVQLLFKEGIGGELQLK